MKRYNSINRLKKYEEIDFTKVVSNSTSIPEILKKLELKNSVESRKRVLFFIKKYKINCDHFKRNTYLQNNIGQKSINSILLENSSYPTTHLKEKLYREGLKERKCELCGQEEMWKGKRMSLILDHINGINNDHRIENLRIVCPNCNATSETFKGRNIKKRAKVYYCECGETIWKGSKKCSKCSNIDKRKFERPDINILNENVKKFGYSKTGEIYGVSDNTIRKWIGCCKNWI